MSTAQTTIPAKRIRTVTRNKLEKVTQSYRLFRLFKQKGAADTEELAKTLGLKSPYVGPYLAELKRVYGAEVVYDRDSGKYSLENLDSIDVPPNGSRGRKRGSGETVKVIESSKLRQSSLSKTPEDWQDDIRSALKALQNSQVLQNRAKRTLRSVMSSLGVAA